MVLGYKFRHFLELLLMQFYNLTTLSLSNFWYLPIFWIFSVLGPPQDLLRTPKWFQMVLWYKFRHILELLLMQLYNLTTLSVCNFWHLPIFGVFSPRDPPRTPFMCCFIVLDAWNTTFWCRKWISRWYFIIVSCFSAQKEWKKGKMAEFLGHFFGVTRLWAHF